MSDGSGAGYYIKAKNVGDSTDNTYPIGTTEMWIADEEEDMVKKGWLKCNGRVYDPSDYPDLFSLIGYKHCMAPAVTNWSTPRFGVPTILDDGTVVGQKCFHVWKKYIGFTQVYDYCSVCGEKKYDK